MSKVEVPPSPHSLFCSLCKDEYYSKADWHRHLLTDKHQILARRRYLKKRSVQKLTDCCVVVFSSFPLTSGLPEEEGINNHGGMGGVEKVIQSLSKDLTTFVTDFVNWKSRPRLGVAQFESKAKVDHLMSVLGSPPELLIDRGRISIRRAADLMDLEWKAILPQAARKIKASRATRSNKEKGTAMTSTSSQDTKNEDLLEGADIVELNPKSSSKRTNGGRRDLTEEVSSSLEEPTCKKSKKCIEAFTKFPVGPSSDSLIPISVPLFSSIMDMDAPPSIPTPKFSQTSLQGQFSRISSSVRIPDHEFKVALETLAALKSLLRSTYPRAEVKMFRTWFLQLRRNSLDDDQLTFFAYNAIPGRPFPIDANRIDEIFNSDLDFDLTVSSFNPTSSDVKSESLMFWKVRCRRHNVNFRLATDVKYLMETQVCRLAEYLCSFDPRSQSLMTLVYYWTHLNSVKFGKIKAFEETYRNLPEPITLQWLVIFFLCHTKRIPSPEIIQQKPHQVFLDRWTGRDIGFKSDSKFVTKWKSTRRSLEKHYDDGTEEFMLSVLKLFQEFLQFYSGTLEEGPFVLNTRNGTRLKTRKFLGVCGSRRRRKVLASLQERIARDLVDMQKSQLSMGKTKLDREAKMMYEKIETSLDKGHHFITHPFNLMWSLSTSDDFSEVLGMMGETGNKLGDYLSVREMSGAKEADKKLGPLTEMLTVP